MVFPVHVEDRLALIIITNSCCNPSLLLLGCETLNILDFFRLQRLYNQGARKVVVFGIGPLFKTPFFRVILSKMTAAQAKALTKSVDGAIKALNTELLHLVTAMPADNVTFPMLTMIYMDTYGAVNDLIEDRVQYGMSWLISLVSQHFSLHTCALYWEISEFRLFPSQL